MTSYDYSPRMLVDFFEQVIIDGELQSPRGIPTFEILNATSVLADPLDRVATSKKRRINFGFAMAEFLALVAGRDDAGYFDSYIKRYSEKFSSDGEHIDGSYGPRLFSASYDQISGVVEKLKSDQHSRQAVMTIFSGSSDLFGGGGLNTPCTMTLQFLIRGNRLNLITNMRSSDAVKGMAYDVFQFTMLQEVIANELGIDLGTYYHNAGSLHFYTDDADLYRKMLVERHEGYDSWRVVEKMHRSPRSFNIKVVRRMFEMSMYEPSYWTRLKDFSNDKELDAYVRSLLGAMHCIKYRDLNHDEAKIAYEQIADHTILRNLSYDWLASRNIVKEPPFYSKHNFYADEN